MPDYPNGSVPASDLAPLDGQPEAQLRTDAAAAWNRGRRDALARTGILLTVNGWNRTLAEQEAIFLARYEPAATGTGPFNDVRWWNGVRYVRMRSAAAAIPGTSNHGWGIAVDVVDYGAIGQFDHPRRVATFPILARHGWTDTEGRTSIQEPWHLVYDPTTDTHPTTVQEDTMHIFRNAQSGSVGFGSAILVSGGVGARIQDGTQLTALQNSGIAMANLNKAQYDAFVVRFGI